jgi:hypothetical protein
VVGIMANMWPCHSLQTSCLAWAQGPAQDLRRDSPIKPEDNPIAAALALQFVKSVPPEGWRLVELVGDVCDAVEVFISPLEQPGARKLQKETLSANIAEALHSFKKSSKIKESSACELIAVTMDLSGQVSRKEDERMAKYTETVGTVPIQRKELKGPAEGEAARTAERTFILRDRLELLQSHKGFHGQVTFVFSAYVDGEWKILQTKMSFASTTLKGPWKIASREGK